MKVKELIDYLSRLDNELEVFVQVDPKGNDYLEVLGVDDSSVYNENREFFDRDWTTHTAAGFDTEYVWEEYLDKCNDCVVIYGDFFK